jgi:hypothetical protein
MKNVNIYAIIIILTFFCSCRTNVLEKNYIDDKSIHAVKFMSSITTQPYPINEITYWNNTDEHAKLIIRNNDFIKDVMSLKDSTSTYFLDYNYAFITKNGKTIDTIYSDTTLKSWILIKDKKKVYFYDEKGEIAKNLRLLYSFFNECW